MEKRKGSVENGAGAWATEMERAHWLVMSSSSDGGSAEADTDVPDRKPAVRWRYQS